MIARGRTQKMLEEALEAVLEGVPNVEIIGMSRRFCYHVLCYRFLAMLESHDIKCSKIFDLCYHLSTGTKLTFHSDQNQTTERHLLGLNEEARIFTDHACRRKLFWESFDRRYKSIREFKKAKKEFKKISEEQQTVNDAMHYLEI